MKREKVKDLIRECLALMKRMENLEDELKGLRSRFDKYGSVALRKKTEAVVQTELRAVRGRFKKTGGLLCGCRSREFIRFVVSCVLDLGEEYEKEECYQTFLSNLISILTHFDQYDADRRERPSIGLLHSYDNDTEIGQWNLSPGRM